MAALAALVRSAAWPSLAEARDSPVAVGVIGGAWLALVVHDLGPTHGSHGLFAETAAWTVMSVAMMGLAVLPAIRHVAASSLRWRRSRAVVEFTVVYGAVWVAFGVVALAVTSRIGRSLVLVVVALALAILWQLTQLKQRFLRRCHRAVPLPPTGLRATLGCMRFGWVHGTACLGSCWCLMGVMAAAPGGHAAWGAILTTLVLRERVKPKPRQAARQATAPLAALVLAIALIG